MGVPKRRELRLLKAALPLVMAEAAYSVIYLTDTSMVAQLGKIPLAALGTAMTLLWVIAIFGIGYLATVNTLAAQYNARGEPRRCGESAWQGLWVSAISWGVVLAVFSPLAVEIFALFGHDEAVQAFEVRYFLICLFSLGPELGAITLSAFFVATGYLWRPMIGAVLAATSNAILNYALIWGNLGFPELGMSGSAWATVIASTLHFAYLFGAFLFATDRALGTRNSNPNFSTIRKLNGVGLPAGIQAAVDYFIWGVVVIAFIGTFGTNHLAAAAVILNLAHAAYLPADGIGTHILAQVADAVGRGKYHLARIRAHHGMKLVLYYLGGIGLVVALFRTPLMEFFSQDAEVIEIGKQAILLLALIFVVDAIGLVLLHSLQGAGDTAWPAAAGIACGVIFMVGGGAAVILLVPKLGSIGIWGCAALYATAQSVLLMARWRSGRWTDSLAL